MDTYGLPFAILPFKNVIQRDDGAPFIRYKMPQRHKTGVVKTFLDLGVVNICKASDEDIS